MSNSPFANLVEALNHLSWPGAVVISVGLIAASCALIAFVIAATGSNFPWEK